MEHLRIGWKNMKLHLLVVYIWLISYKLTCPFGSFGHQILFSFISTPFASEKHALEFPWDGSSTLEVTSYNEWGEGTQIEPAKKHRSQKGGWPRFGGGQPGPKSTDGNVQGRSGKVIGSMGYFTYSYKWGIVIGVDKSTDSNPLIRTSYDIQVGPINWYLVFFWDFLHVLVFVYPTKRRSPVVPCFCFFFLICRVFFNSTMHLKVFVGKLTVEHRGVELYDWTTQVAWCVKLTMCWCLERLSDQNGFRVSIWKIGWIVVVVVRGGAFSLAFKP